MTEEGLLPAFPTSRVWNTFPGVSYRAKCKHVYQGDLCDHWKKRPSQLAPKMPLFLLFAVSFLIVRIQSDFCYCQYGGILFNVKLIITCDILNFIAPPTPPPPPPHTHTVTTPQTPETRLSASRYVPLYIQRNNYINFCR